MIEKSVLSVSKEWGLGNFISQSHWKNDVVETPISLLPTVTSLVSVVVICN